MAAISPHSLAFAHWFRSFLGGLVGLAVIIPLLNLLHVVNRYWQALPTNNLYYDSGNSIGNWILGSAFFLFFGAIFLGILAFLVGLLRVWPMKLLITRQVLRPEWLLSLLWVGYRMVRKAATRRAIAGAAVV